jgi:hypothetical protein
MSKVRNRLRRLETSGTRWTRTCMAAGMTVADAPGFQGVLSGTTLPDLIQMSCLTLATRAVHIEAEAGEGCVFLSGGQVVHAKTREVQGEEAFFQILNWGNGRFWIEEGLASGEESITRVVQSLLLEAAYRLDESQRSDEGEVKAVTRSDTSEMTPKAPEAAPKAPLDGADVESWVRFTLQGETRGGRAVDLEELQSCWAYVLELARALGHTLGLVALRAIETRGPQVRGLCQLENDEVRAIVSGPRTDLVALAQRVR